MQPSVSRSVFDSNIWNYWWWFWKQEWEPSFSWSSTCRRILCGILGGAYSNLTGPFCYLQLWFLAYCHEVWATDNRARTWCKATARQTTKLLRIVERVMKNIVAKLMQCGLLDPNPTSFWALTPLLALESDSTQKRVTTYLKPVNLFKERNQFPTPVFEHKLKKRSKSGVHSNFNFVHTYWQLPLMRKSQASQHFLTLDTLYSRNRVAHGTTKAVTNIQSSLMQMLPQELTSNLLFWLDECLIHSPSVTASTPFSASAWNKTGSLNQPSLFFLPHPFVGVAGSFTPRAYDTIQGM